MLQQSKTENTLTIISMLVKFKPFFLNLDNHTCSCLRAELESKGLDLLLLKANFERFKNDRH